MTSTKYQAVINIIKKRIEEFRHDAESEIEEVTEHMDVVCRHFEKDNAWIGSNFRLIESTAKVVNEIINSDSWKFYRDKITQLENDRDEAETSLIFCAKWDNKFDHYFEELEKI